MAVPETTVWELEPHTRAKHEILRRYMQAWIPILAQGGYPELVYIDGFAGPGRYSKGEDGSPIIALKAALEHQNRISATIRFLFVEERSDRAGVLAQILNEIERPPRFLVYGGTNFEQAVTSFLDQYASKGQRLPPTFAFIDPFGWAGVPFDLVRRILSYRSCEALITFMYEGINRFIGQPQQEANFDRFFGTGAWRQGITLGDPRARNRYLHDLYLHQLRESARVRYVRSFEMRNDRDVTDYYLFYATNSLLGLKKMKESMWKVDQSGEFTFSDATNPNQLVLFGKEPQFETLQRQVTERLQGQEPTIRAVEEFVVAETALLASHYKRVLKSLELSEPPRLLIIDPPAGRRPGTYADLGLRIRFL